ncbi:MAG: PD-(D/E)XK nuclease family protein [Clostridiales bacterium]|jgi:ATP-dependent helicase/nuclease subunit B|nr:PD-(D/E)XK nuclease family protein [Clostridiales bacterium]
MVCRFVIGRAGSGKNYHFLQFLRRELLDSPLGPPLFYLVPEQATFIAEQALASQEGLVGFSRAEITSFRRLAFRAWDRGPRLPLISELGKTLLVQKILLSNKDRLQVLGSSGAGSARDVLALLKEFQQQKIVWEEIDKSPLPARLQSKLADLTLISRELETELAQGYADPEAGLNWLAQSIEAGDFLADATVLVNGFSGFSGQEMAVLGALMEKARRLEIGLLLDQEGIDDDNPAAPFFPVRETYLALAKMAFEREVQVEETMFLECGEWSVESGVGDIKVNHTGKKEESTQHSTLNPQKWSAKQTRFGDAPELAFLERQFFPLVDDSLIWDRRPRHLRLLAARNRRAEVLTLGREILRLVRTGFRFRDIGVIFRQSQDYQPVLETVFTELNIPFFLDQKKPLYYHPLVELIRSALEAAMEGWHYQVIFRYLKNKLLPFEREDIDILENYCLSNGIRAYHWKYMEDWTFWRKELESRRSANWRKHLEEINRTRRLVTKELALFCESVSGAGQMGQICDAIRSLLAELKVKDRLLASNEPIDSQAWQEIEGLLAQLELFLGSEELPLIRMGQIIESGLLTLQASLAPTGLDQVFISSIERSRNPGLKIAFLPGLNEGEFPLKINSEGIFSAADRRALAGLGLAADSENRQLNESLLIYIALTRASGQLYCSYPAYGESGEVLLPSLIISRLKKLFPELKIEEDWQPMDQPLLSGGSDGLAQLIQSRQENNTNQNLSPLWQEVDDWYRKQPAYGPLWEKIDNTLNRENRLLTSATVENLYGRILFSSVSQLETYRRCPLSYFAAYALRLAERPVYQLTPLDSGQFYHTALAEISQTIREQAINWAALDGKRSLSLVENQMNKLLPGFLGQILSSSARYRYLAERIKKNLTNQLLLTAQHLRQGRFFPAAWEISFSERGPLPAWRLPLAENKSLKIRGKIDRIDLAFGREKTWLRIIDYKTGQADLRPEDIEKGSKLQLMVYLQVALANSGLLGAEEAEAAGIYYSLLHDNPLAGPPPEEGQEPSPGERGLRLVGLSVKEEEAVQLADREISGFSNLIPVAMKKNGEFYSNSPGVTREEMGQLLEHITGILSQTGQEILQGRVEAKPQQDNCRYCNYHAFCGFDKIN